MIQKAGAFCPSYPGRWDVMSMYNFNTEYAKQLYDHVTMVVPIAFIKDNGMPERGRMDFNENSQSVEIRYKSTSNEIVSIAHELLHVRMEFQDHFPLLAWPTNHPDLTPGIQDIVKRIRDVVDDTYILHQLFANTGVLPISNVFYREIRKDIKRGIIHIVQNLPIESRPIVTAWRLRLADLSISEYGEKLTANQRRLSADFISLFQSKEPAAHNLFIHLKQNVVGSSLSNGHKLGTALIDLRNKLALPSWLHLATRQNIDGRWVLKQ